MNPGRASVLILIAATAAAALAAGAFFFLGDNGGSEEGTVVYHGNGGLTADGSDTYEVRGDTVSANGFVNENELFASWNTAADGSGQLFNAGDHIDSGGRIDLYAQWGVTAAFEGAEDRYGSGSTSPKGSGARRNPSCRRTAPCRSRTTGARPSWPWGTEDGRTMRIPGYSRAGSPPEGRRIPAPWASKRTARRSPGPIFSRADGRRSTSRTAGP